MISNNEDTETVVLGTVRVAGKVVEIPVEASF